MVSVPAVGVIAASGGGLGASSSANASLRASPTAGNLTSSTHAKSKSTPVNSNGYHPPNTQTPLSSMTSPPLDLNSVERRGQPTASRENVKRKNRPHGLEEAPTYYPTEKEWKDPMDFMRKITPEAKNYGLCKIVPPESWNPPFAIDTQKFHFRTRKQELNSVEGSTRANLSYLDALAKFHKQQGNNLNRLPYVDKKPLDLYRLKKAVEARGGFDKVCKLKKWAEIGRDLGYSGKIMSSLSTSLKNSYQRWLCPYEEYLRLAKPGVHQQIELENGGPFTPSPAPSPMKRSNVNTPNVNTPSSLRGDSPARHATDALQTTMNGHLKDSDKDTPMVDVPAPAPAPTSGGFTAINTGGFTSINRPAPVENKPFTPPKLNGSPFSSAKNTPEYRPSTLGPANALKRQLSCDSLDLAKKDNCADKDDGDASNSRRSKRLKKDTVPTVAGSHMSLFRPSIPRIPGIPKDESATPGEKCEQCGKGNEASFLAVCESCDHAYHGTCLDPPLRVKPDSEWNCPRCLVGDGQFGFEEGGLYSLKRFQEKANDFKQGYFENKMPTDPTLNCLRPVTEDDVEREFWRLVASIEETVEVEYGADIHCTTHGSGFPTMEKNPDDPYATDPWNLNLLPLHPESLFRHIKSDISGMTVPWVYVGMIFSTFCWHNEDHYSYSANYQHFGATKTWYGIPGEDAEKFENAMKDAVPELFETQPDLLFQLVTLLPPEQLKKAGVRVYALDQRAGQLVVTFPQAYHAGFNHGFNFNEAVNFAPCDWEKFGLAGVERLQQFRRQPCFSHDELLWTAAEGVTSGGLTIQTAKWLAPALERIHNREITQREGFLAKHLESSPHECSLNGGEDHTCPLLLRIEDEDVAEEEYQCVYCKAYTYLSRFKCLNSSKVMCLQHAGSHPCCDVPENRRILGDRHVLFYRKAGDVISATYRKVADKAHQPEAWEEKYEKFLDEEATPSLKALRNLLGEGEKIPFDLPSLPILRDFVDRCNHWVEEATNYTVRKQQNRRKSDKGLQTSRRKSIGSLAQDQREREMRNVSNISRLLDEATLIGFDCPEILQLQERAESIEMFQQTAKQALANNATKTVENLEELLDEGHSFNVDIPEVDQLAKALDKEKWNQKAEQNRKAFMTIDYVRAFLDEGRNLGLPPYTDNMRYYQEQLNLGHSWETKAKELIHAETVHYPQLEALSTQASQNNLPVSPDTLALVDQILHKQREAHRQIIDLNERSRQADYRQRPKYAEVVDVTKKIEDLQSKPHGTLELEKEQRRHEDWMRKGKKLFGKTNAPLHILKSHMEYVLDRNQDCFDVAQDKPRVPAEPASREPSPEEESLHRWEDPRFREVFCICRRVEAGMMIECEFCHEWYHGKCLKIARGKVKEDDKYKCPVCDWRVKIPRDAARPSLEALQQWYDEIPNLPFQPEEEEVLKKIIDGAQDFRTNIAPHTHPLWSAPSAAETQRFYLRKIEGAEVLLVAETNFFRQELHKWCPVAPVPPPVIDASNSTRKPRPTKLQKLLQQYKVDDPDDLPESVKGKANSLKRKALNAEAAADLAYQRGSGIGAPATSPTGYGSHTHYPRATSSQPHTPGLSIASSSHAHPPRGPDSASSSRGHSHGHAHGLSDSSGLKGDGMDIIGGPVVTRPLYIQAGGTGERPRIIDPAIALETRLLYGGFSDVNIPLDPVGREQFLELERARRSKEMFGPNEWSGEGPQEDNEGEVDRMFTDLVNQDEDEDSGLSGKKDREGNEPTAADLEKERNGVDALLDGE